MSRSLAIVIPVYNEGESITATLQAIQERVRSGHTVYIVYDMDDDNTLPAVQPFIERGQPIVLLKNRYGRGALNAIKTGLHFTTEPQVAVVMADLSDDLARIDDMIKKAGQGCDIVCGSRYMKGGRQIGGPWFKGMLSRLAGVSLFWLAGIPTHDITNSFKLYSRRIIESLTIESNGGFELGMELVVKAHQAGFRVGQVPSTWQDRSAGQSRFRLWKWLPKYLRWYRLALRSRWIK